MKILLLCFLNFVLFSCTHSIKVKTPVHKFITAESQGKPLKGKASIYALNGSEATIDISNDRTDNKLDVDGGIFEVYDIGLTGELGVYGPVDLTYISGGSKGASIYALKVQILGDRKIDAKEKGYSISLLAGFGSEKKKEQEGNDVELWPEDDDTTTTLKVTNQTLGTVFSYRQEKGLIHTLGLYLANHHFSGELESQNDELDGQNLDYKGTAQVATLGSTWDFNDTFYSGYEIAYEVIKWERTSHFTQTHINFNIGFYW